MILFECTESCVGMQILIDRLAIGISGAHRAPALRGRLVAGLSATAAGVAK